MKKLSIVMGKKRTARYSGGSWALAALFAFSVCLFGCEGKDGGGDDEANPMAELTKAERVDVTVEDDGQQITVSLPEVYGVQEGKYREELVPESGKEPGPYFTVSLTSQATLEASAENIQGTRVKERKVVDGAHIVVTRIGSEVDVYVFAPSGEQGVKCRGSYKGKAGRDEAIEFIEEVCLNARVEQ